MMLDPVYADQFHIQRTFQDDLDRYKEHLTQGDIHQQRTAREFFEHYQRAGGIVPDEFQAVISNPQVAPTGDPTPEQIEYLQSLRDDVTGLQGNSGLQGDQ